MNDIQVFKDSAFGELEILQENDKFWFPAIRCAEILGYQNPYDAISKHCRGDGVAKREVVSLTVNQYGKETEQIVEKKYITEGNLYRLIVSSRLETAQQFERWVFDEVLPEIRKNGGYNAKKDTFEIASMLSKCPTVKLGVVLEVLKRGGYDVPELKTKGLEIKRETHLRGKFKNERNPEVIAMIKDLCENYGIKMTCIADEIGVSHSSISHYVNGKRYPDKYTEKKLIDTLNRLKEKAEKEKAESD